MAAILIPVKSKIRKTWLAINEESIYDRKKRHVFCEAKKHAPFYVK
jgi:hypothetical protein